MTGRFTFLFLLALLVSRCNYREFRELSKHPHSPYLHYMEGALAPDMASDDSLTAAHAKKMLTSFSSVYEKYKPSLKRVSQLKPLLAGVKIRVIGGNWCSDTRRELPRLCKVLFLSGLPVDSFGYYRVDKKKKAIAPDFAAAQPVTKVPTVFVYKNNVLRGSIVEVPQKSWEADLLVMLKHEK